MKNKKDQINSDRRQYGRLTVTEVQSSLGKIVNISAGGMVVRGKNANRSYIEIELGEGDDRISVLAKQIWTSRAGLFMRLTGYKFLDPPEGILTHLYDAKLTSRTQRVI